MKTILVIDDEKKILEEAQKLLCFSYQVDTATSVEESICYLQQNEPDLVMIDIGMPEMDGFALIKYLQERKILSEIPILFMASQYDSKLEEESFLRGAIDFIVKPLRQATILQKVQFALELSCYKRDLEGAIAEQADELVKQNRKINWMQQEVIISMANLIESRDGSTGGHIKRSAIFVNLIAKQLRRDGKFPGELTSEYYHHLCKAAPMHDIGKIIVPDYVLKNAGNLNPEEFELMKSHAVAGGKIIRENLGKIEDPVYIDIAADVATYHHEKWDGSGYPEGRKGTEIPLCARIMAVADVFDALAFSRYYKDALGVAESYRMIEKSSGTHFDPVVVEAFIKVRPEIEELFQKGYFV